MENVLNPINTDLILSIIDELGRTKEYRALQSAFDEAVEKHLGFDLMDEVTEPAIELQVHTATELFKKGFIAGIQLMMSQSQSQQIVGARIRV